MTIKKILQAVFVISALWCGANFQAPAVFAAYPYPQNYLLDQRRFDTQQANNLVMRRLSSSTTGQWAVAVVDITSASGVSISTATYGMLTSTGTTVLTPGFAVTRFSLLTLGGLTTAQTNATGGMLTLDDGMSYDQIFDTAISTFSLSVYFSTGVVHYSITGIR